MDLKQFTQLDALSLRARMTGRSYWEVGYANGKTVAEPDPGVDWLHLKHKGLRWLRLACPNGQVAVLGNDAADCGDRLFQFKIAVAGLGGRATEAHVIGMVTNLDGGCTCWAWEYGPKRLVRFTDDVRPGLFVYGGGMTLDFAHLGIRPD